MKVALLKNYPTDSKDLGELFKNVGMNSGNIVYWESIIRLFNPDIVPYKESGKLAEYDAVIITDLCWIRENVDYGYIENLVDKLNIPIIPMSIGLQNDNFDPNFKLSEQVIRMLKKMQERAVLGVRGEYTASILKKHGITNIAVIGCPSMYYWNNRNLKIEDNGTPVNVCCNYKSLGEKLNPQETSILKYFADNKFLFVEQTWGGLNRSNVHNEKDFQYISDYINDNKLLEFTYQTWAEKLKNYNFSLGFRYHGNVLPLHQNIKALFVTIDSRTQEMINLFHLPHIKKEEFDVNKPIEYYFKLADYKKFNDNYPKMFDTFTKFVADNNLRISENATPIDFVAKKNVTKIEKLELEKISLIELFKEFYNLCVKNKDLIKDNRLIQTFLSLYQGEVNKKDNYLKTEMTQISLKEFDTFNFLNKKETNLAKDCFLESVGDGTNSSWRSSHSQMAYFDVQEKALISKDEKQSWNILSQKLDHANLKGKELTLSVRSQSINHSKLNLFARYQLNGQMKYLGFYTVQNNDESTDYLTFEIPNDIPNDAEVYFGVYLNEPNTKAIVKEIKLFY